MFGHLKFMSWMPGSESPRSPHAFHPLGGRRRQPEDDRHVTIIADSGGPGDPVSQLTCGRYFLGQPDR